MSDAEIAKKWRRTAGLTQRAAAETWSVTRVQWWRYEAGVSRIPRARRELLVDALLERLLVDCT